LGEYQLFTLTEKDWEKATPELRDWYIYNALLTLGRRLDDLERKSWFHKGCAFVGGMIGGVLATMGIKLT